MAVVTGAVGSLISKLAQLLNEEYKLQKSAQKKINSLIKELECARTALYKAGRVPPDQLDEHVKIWAREVREASYDMEDIIDTFLVHSHGPHQPNIFRSIRDLIGKLFERRKIVIAMDDINKRLEEVTQRYGRYTVVDNIAVARSESIDPRLAVMYKEVKELVGIDKSNSELKSMLSTTKMVSVVGVGGLGKTTLAKSVYDQLKLDFGCSAFAPVGRNPDIRKVFRDIFRQIDKEKYNEHIQFYSQATIRQLIDELRETFHGNKRYLLVIDDLWDMESWETIKLALVLKNKGSRVITTTRIWEVAKEAGEVYKLEHLPYDKSKKLFYTRLFGAEGKCPDNELDEVSDGILKKCDGVPLAIITMACLLAAKSREEWIDVCSYFAFVDKGNKQVRDTEWILSLSYYDLPHHLKTCLLYLSVFPEDQIINKDSLIWKWVAEGFVHNGNTPGTRLFEVGNGYFNELINRSMIQAVESEGDNDIVVGCRVHDMVLDLLRLKSHEENFVNVSNTNIKATSSSPRRTRRLTLHNHTEEHTQWDLRHVRSFIAYECDFHEGLSFRSFKLLRVLALEHCDKYIICLKHLENLVHLRYLGLGHSFILEIPEEIGSLKFLQTMDLKHAMVAKQWLPSNLCLLTQLICITARSMMVPNGVIGKLTSLEELEIDIPSAIVGNFATELGVLCELRVLYASFGELNDSEERKLLESIANLHKIQTLNLVCKYWNIRLLDKLMCETIRLPRSLRYLTLIDKICFSELPSCISPSGLPNLIHLNLRVHYMEDRHLKILGELTELRHLELKIEYPNNAAKVIVATTAGTSTITDGCFKKLRSLSFPQSAVIFFLNENSSIVLFVLNKDSNIPFAIGNRTVDSGIKKRDKFIGAPAVVMPNLQVLNFLVDLRGGVHNGICGNLGLDCLPSLQRVRVGLWCYEYLAADDVKRERAALRHAIEGHPNRSMLRLKLHIRSDLQLSIDDFGRESEEDDISSIENEDVH